MKYKSGLYSRLFTFAKNGAGDYHALMLRFNETFFKRLRVPRRVYLDHAAATPLDARVVRRMRKFETTQFANPSSIHTEGVGARREIEIARKQIAEHLGAHTDEVIFTGSGTESNAFALRGVVDAYRKEHPGVIPVVAVSSVEHSSVRSTLAGLEAEGAVRVVEIPVDEGGVVNLKMLKEALTDEVVLVSIMYANNEIGTTEPIREIMKLVRHHRKETGGVYPYVHTDACQATQFLDINVGRLGVDLMTLNAAKIYGPKGIGALFVRRGVALGALIPGEQERGLRGGTENGVGIVGFAEALVRARTGADKESIRLTKLTDRLENMLRAKILGVVINRHPTLRLPHILHFSVPGFTHDFLALALDAKGFAVSTGSACTSADSYDSRGILALGKEGITGGVRVSLGKGTTARDMDAFVKALLSIIERNAQFQFKSDL